jgi:diacylglycerol kinase (ATP)
MGAARVLIIANPTAGTTSPALVWELVRICRRVTPQISVRWTTTPGEATAIARKAAESSVGAPVVVAVGGDGTVREVAAGLASAWHGGTPTPLLIVPAGTANSNYRTLFDTSPWQSTVETVLRSPFVRWLDLARVAGRLVFSGASSGFPARGLHEARALSTHNGPRRLHAALANLAPRYRPYPGRVTVDGRIVHSGLTLLANVGGSRFRGGHFELLPRSEPDDGLLDVCVLDGELSLTEMMELTQSGAHLSRPGVVYEQGRQVRIERTDGQPLWFEHDGEVLPLGPSEYTVDVVPAAVPVLTTAPVTLAA